jgi:parallel beta-helix repeat protein
MKTSRLVLTGAVISLAILTASLTHAAVPGQPTTVSPVGKVAGSTITFLWNPVSGAIKYNLQVKNGSLFKVNTIFTATQANCSEGIGTCSAEVTIGNGAAPLSWTLRAGNTTGFGAWSEAKAFTMTDEMRTPISKLPYTITASGSFYMTANLTSTGAGITVNADDVTIDLNGYTLTGPGSGANDGISMNGRKNVEVRNGTVRGFAKYGIYEATDIGGHRLLDLRVFGNGASGIYLYGRGHLVERCTAEGNGADGIFVSYDSAVTGCTARGNGGNGIYAGEGSTVSGNTAAENGGSGILADPGITIKNNTCRFNQRYGIELSASNLLDGNTAYQNNQSGQAYTNIKTCPTCTWGLNQQ